GAEVDEFLPGCDRGRDLLDLAMQQRLAASNDDDRRTAFLDRLNALRHAEPLVQDRIGVIDLAAAGTGKVAAEQRLQHQDERVTLYPAQMLSDDVGANTNFLMQRNRHELPRFKNRSVNRRPRFRPARTGCETEHSRSIPVKSRPRRRSSRAAGRSTR